MTSDSKSSRPPNKSTGIKHKRGKAKLVGDHIPTADRRRFNVGFVVDANPSNAVIAPVPDPALNPILVRTLPLRYAFRKTVTGLDGVDRIYESIEITIPAEVIRALGLEAGMNMVMQVYPDGRIMIVRAGAYVEPERGGRERGGR